MRVVICAGAFEFEFEHVALALLDRQDFS